MTSTVEDIRITKQALEGQIISLLEEFANLHNIYDMEVNVCPIVRLAGVPMFDVEVVVKI